MNVVITAIAAVLLAAVTSVAGVHAAEPKEPSTQSPGMVVSYADE
ncbi:MULTISPECIES: hypothetical protein [unclassified Nocardioides]|nr:MULTISPECIES: hypothetical protein [unclassified Nocardioides]